MQVLGVKPARGGCKGIPRKNLVPLAGKPLLSYTVRADQDSHRLTRTILSTDDDAIVAVGRQSAADVPFGRPAELATEDASSVEVAEHALRLAETEDAKTYDCVCLLQPTAPLRTSTDIDNAIKMLECFDADSVVSVALIDEPHPVKMMSLHDGLIIPYLPIGGVKDYGDRSWKRSIT
jgi:CMP-N-acetylneuraminic acid synthetase